MNDTAKPKVIPAEELKQSMRQQLVGNKPKLKSKVITIRGNEIEFRQPTLDSVLQGQAVEGDTKTQVCNFIIYNAYVPGTDITVFEPADMKAIQGWPFDEEFRNITTVMNELMGLDITGTEQELAKDPLAEA